MNDESGSPVGDATVAVYYGRERIMTSTTGAGNYEADFETDQLQYYGTAGIVGVVQAWRGDEYEYYVQSVPWGEGAIVNVVRNLRLRRVRTISAGQSTTVSIEPDSSLAHDGEDWLGVDWLWEKFHIRVDTAGTLTLEARAQAGGIVPTLAVYCVYTKDNCRYDWVTWPSGSARSLRVQANSLFEIRVAIPTQSAPQRYEFSTSLAQ